MCAELFAGHHPESNIGSGVRSVSDCHAYVSVKRLLKGHVQVNDPSDDDQCAAHRFSSAALSRAMIFD
jgi:hypothetical protein